jgi:hypothetical protein
MTREEAQRECERLVKKSPERETHRWIPNQQPDGEWTVAKIGLPPVAGADGKPETRGDEKPPTPADPRGALPEGWPWIGPG